MPLPDRDRIALADCVEGRQVTAAVAALPDNPEED